MTNALLRRQFPRNQLLAISEGRISITTAAFKTASYKRHIIFVCHPSLIKTRQSRSGSELLKRVRGGGCRGMSHARERGAVRETDDDMRTHLVLTGSECPLVCIYVQMTRWEVPGRPQLTHWLAQHLTHPVAHSFTHSATYRQLTHSVTYLTYLPSSSLSLSLFTLSLSLSH